MRARYAIVPSFRRSVAVRDALDALNAMRPLIWDGGPIAPAAGTPPPGAVLCLRLPSRDELRGLAVAGAGAPVTVFVSGVQLTRSEERRVGKEWWSRCDTDVYKVEAWQKCEN